MPTVRERHATHPVGFFVSLSLSSCGVSLSSHHLLHTSFRRHFGHFGSGTVREANEVGSERRERNEEGYEHSRGCVSLLSLVTSSFSLVVSHLLTITPPLPFPSSLIPYGLSPTALMSDRRERLETERSVAEAEPKGTSDEVKDTSRKWKGKGSFSSSFLLPCRSTHHLVRHGARRGRVNDGGVNEEPGGRSEDEVGMNDERT